MTNPISRAAFMLAIIIAFAIQNSFGYSQNLKSNSLQEDHLKGGALKGTLKAAVYIVDDDISVNKGETLVIEAGAILKFQFQKGFKVEGRLIANGESLKNIVFTSIDTTQTWSGISFQEGPSPEFSFCSVRHTKSINNNWGAIRFLHSGFNKINDCIFEYNESGAISLNDIYGESIEINRNTIQNCDDFGIYCTLANVSGSFKCYDNSFKGKDNTDKDFTGFVMLSAICNQLDFNGNKFSKCDKDENSTEFAGAIFINNSNKIKEIRLNGDTIDNCTTKGGSIFIDPQKLDTFKAKNIIVTDNYGDYGGAYVRSRSVFLDSCTFKRNGGGGAITLLPNDLTSDFSVSNSTFELNTDGKTYGGAIRISGNKQYNLAALKITKCEFTTNTSISSGGAVFIDGLKSINNLVIEECTFENNRAKEDDGGVLSITNTGSIDSVSFINSKKISGNHSGKHGGVFNFSGIGLIGNFSYTGNTHGLESANYTDKENGGNGGIGNIDVTQIKNITIADNKAIFSSADQNGGAFNIQTDPTLVSSNLIISRNSVPVSTKAINGSGGFVYLSGNLSGDFSFQGNSITEASSKDSGGTIYFNNQKGKLTNLEYAKNEVKTSSTAGSGGLIYYVGAISELVNISGNPKLNSTASMSGGAVYIKNTDTNGLKVLNIDGNTRVEKAVSETGAGGFLYYTGSLNGCKFNFNSNAITSSAAKLNGGVICFENINGKVSDFNFLGNTITMAKSDNSGGLMYYNGAISGTLHIIGNDVLNSTANTNGGAFYFNNTDPTGVNGIWINDNLRLGNFASTTGSGGLLFYSGKASGNLEFKGNFLSSFSAGKDGGGVYFENLYGGKLMNLEFSNNSVGATSKGGSGGLIYYVGAISELVNISGNPKLNSTASMSGGAVYIKNTDTNGLKVLNIDGNTRVEKAVSETGAGGFLYYTGSLDGCKFNFNKNTITSSLAKLNGGALCFENINGQLSDFNFSGNTITMAKSDDSGGLMYYNGAISGTLHIDGNDVLNSTANTNGGAFYFNNTDPTGVNGIWINDNQKLGNFASTTGSGGLLFYSGKAIGNLVFTRNTISGSKAGADGGTVYFKNLDGTLKDMEYSGNSIESTSTVGSGGLLFYEGAILGALKIDANLKLNSTSGKNGGAFYINHIGDNSLTGISISNNKQFGTFASTSGSGGLLYYTGKANGNFAFTGNTITRSTAGADGGTVYLKNGGGTLTGIEYSRNSIESTTATTGSGGLLFYDGAISGAIKVDSNTKLKSIAGKDGGAFYINHIGGNSLTGISIINNSGFGNFAATNGSGGLLYYNGKAIGDFAFTGNAITSSTAGADGGTVYLINAGGTLTGLVYSGNSVESTISGSSGGLLFYEGAISGVITVKDNFKLNSTAGNNGGAFSIKNAIVSGQLNFNIDGNQLFGNLKASNGSGGLLYYYGDGSTTGNFVFKTNTIMQASSKGSGGTIFFSNQNGTLRNIECLNNSVKTISEDDAGGFLFYNGGISEAIRIKNNTNLKSESFNNGGAFSLSNNAKNGLKIFEIYKNNIESKSKNSSGGFVYYNGRILDEIMISGNTYPNLCSALGDGGIYNFEIGTVNSVDINTETINLTEAIANGGYLAVAADSISSFTFTGINVKEKAKATKNGGLAYIKVKNPVGLLTLCNITAFGTLEANSGALLSFDGSLKSNGKIFSINNNTFNSATTVGSDGGLIHFNGVLNQDFEFNGNTLKNNISANGNGGIICLKNNSGSSKNITISGNTFVNPEAVLKASNGGVLYIDGNYKLENINVRNNDFLKLKLIGVTKSGGLAFVNNRNTENEIIVLDFNDNKMNELKADSVGGLVYGKASFSGTIRFNLLSVKKSTASNGGVIEITNTSKTGLSKFEFSNGVIAEANASKGNGAVVNYNAGAAKVDTIIVYENVVTKAVSANTGAFSFNTGTMNSVSSTANSFSGSSASYGGTYYFKAPQINFAVIKDDDFTNCSALSRGAGVFFDVTKMDSVKFISTKIKANTAQYGGFGSFKDGITIGKLEFSNTANKPVEDCAATKDGGILYIKGTILNAKFDSNYFYHNYAGGNGGLVYFEDMSGVDHPSSLMFTTNSCMNNDDLKKNKYESGGSGGALYLYNLNKVNIANCKFDGVYSAKSGGAVYMSSVNELNFSANKSYNNKAYAAGVIYLKDINAANFNKNIYVANEAQVGGAIYFENGNLQVDGDEVDNNTATSKAGGFYISQASGVIKNSIFQNNEVSEKSTYGGGGLYLSEINPDGINLTDNIFKNNSSQRGSAAFLSKSKSRFTRNKFIENTSHSGGTVYFNEGCSDTELLNCLFYNNKSEKKESGSAIMVNPLNAENDENGNTFKITNCTIFGHPYYGFYVENNPNSNKYQISNSILHGNNGDISGGSKFGPQTWVPEGTILIREYSNIANLDSAYTNCISVVPGFEQNSFCLAPGSDCIDAGNPDPSFNDSAPLSIGLPRNDMGITGGPERFTDCNSILRPDTTPITNSESISLVESFEVFPNPTSREVNLRVFLDEDIVVVELSSMIGKVLFQSALKENYMGKVSNLSIPELAKGVYIIRLRSKTRSYSKQLIII